MKLLVINGPNLNFLGIREKGIYGTQDYQYLVNLVEQKAQETGCEIEVWQSNHEGAIIDKIQEAYFNGTEGIIINPGAYTHTSIAIADAIVLQRFCEIQDDLIFMRERAINKCVKNTENALKRWKKNATVMQTHKQSECDSNANMNVNLNLKCKKVA